MTQRIRRFDPIQTAKVMGVIYALMGLIFLPFAVLVAMFNPDTMGFGVGIAILLPVLYGVFGAVMVALACLVYNLVAGWVGGIELDLEPSSRTGPS